MPDLLTNFALLKCDKCADAPMEYTLLLADPKEAGVIFNGQVTATNQCLIPEKHFINKFKQCMSPEYIARLNELNDFILEKLSEPGLDEDDAGALIAQLEIYRQALVIVQQKPTPPYPCIMTPSIWEKIERHMLNGLDQKLIAQVCQVYKKFRAVCEEIQDLIHEAWSAADRLVTSKSISVSIDSDYNSFRVQLIYLRKSGIEKAFKMISLVDLYESDFLWAAQVKGVPDIAIGILKAQIEEFNKSMFGGTGWKRGDKDRMCDMIIEEYSVNHPEMAEMPPLKKCMYTIQRATAYFCNVTTSSTFSDDNYKKLQGSYFDDKLKELIQGLEGQISLLKKKDKVTYLLNKDSVLPCKLGGKITVENCGQWFIDSRKKVPPNFEVLLADIESYINGLSEPDIDALFENAEVEPGSANSQILEQNKGAIKKTQNLKPVVLKVVETIRNSIDGKDTEGYICPAVVKINFYTKNGVNKEETRKNIELTKWGIAFTIAGIIMSKYVSAVAAVSESAAQLAGATAVDASIIEGLFPKLAAEALATEAKTQAAAAVAAEKLAHAKLVSTAVWAGGTIPTYISIVENAKGGQAGIGDAVAGADVIIGGVTQDGFVDLINDVTRSRYIDSSINKALSNIGTPISEINLGISLMGLAELISQQYADFFIGRIELQVETKDVEYTFYQDYDADGNKEGGLQVDLDLYPSTFMQNMKIMMRKQRGELKEEGIYLNDEGLVELDDIINLGKGVVYKKGELD